MDNTEIPWIIIDKYFKDNPSILVKHQLDSYNSFFNNDIKNIFKEKNPIQIMKMQDPVTKEFKLQCKLYLGGKDGDKLYYGKPIIYDDDHSHYMYPNEARLRNMTYGITIHYDVEVDFLITTEETQEVHGKEKVVSVQDKKSITLEKLYLGRFPIMLRSNLCILNKFNRKACFNLGECKNDLGGYFIIDGKEKAIISQEKFADNMLYIRDKGNDLYSHSAEIRSVSEDASKPIRTLSVRIVAPSPNSSNSQIVVNIPNVKKPVPLFILMRALGVLSDHDIIEKCLLDLNKNNEFIDLFMPSIHDASQLFTQQLALKYIATFTKHKTIPHVLEILTDYFLPHIGETNYSDKAYFLGYMVYRLLCVYIKIEKATDRDSFNFKRIELPGKLIYDLFKEYFTLQQRNIYLKTDKEYFYHETKYQNNFVDLIELNYKELFKDRIVEDGFRKAFKGNWGSEEHTKRVGVVQGLNRLSFNSYLSHLRKINLPLDVSAKVIGPRLLHGSQWGIIDPVDTPDGGNIGLHKHMSLGALITNGCSGYPLTQWLRKHIKIKLLQECHANYLATVTKIFVNGAWIGVIEDPKGMIDSLRSYRRNALIPIFMSIQWNIKLNIIYIYTDSGRMCRPVYYIMKEEDVDGIVINNKLSIDRPGVLDKITSKNFTWTQLLCGFAKKKDADFNYEHCKLYNKITDLYDADNIKRLEPTQAVIEYIDTAESESAYIATYLEKITKTSYYTHVEIHPSLILGVMGNQVVFPENNPLPRDLFACGQTKQAVSLYHSNFQMRIDKMGVVLNNGQTPLVKSRYLEYISNEEHPYGENAIVAIMCYNGYNVEDSILFNEGSVKRGLFRTTYFNMYESREESSSVGNNTIDSRFTNIEDENVIGLKPGYDYSYLDKHGLIKENTLLDDKKVLIGKTTTNLSEEDMYLDSSTTPKKGQLGYVDKTFITEGEEGHRLAKVRIREERIPAIGDKFCSRCGQKGTIGLVIPEGDMPYTSDGIRPDIIINPHALPSRMTIGQLVETLMGKACAIYGAYGDCTAFINKGPRDKIFGNLLLEQGYHSSGNQILYNGMNGKQLESEIFIGPTYYMRLKHMVKDKINYRAQGPRTVLTRQTVGGRANDGGLRIGEMERDGIIAHGAAGFLNESMLVRGDEYYMAVCNKSGMLAIYNESLNLFLSPMVDGPIRYTEELTENLNIENISKYGRSFSIVRIPYALKLLMQELQCMNVQMRFITEDNIDQLESMSYSNNMNLLLHKDVIDIKKIAKDVDATKNKQDKLDEVGGEQKTPEDLSISLDGDEELMTKDVNAAEDYLSSEQINPENIGWYLKKHDIDEGLVWHSLILNSNFQPTGIWKSEEQGSDPITYPDGWFNEEMFYKNGIRIPDNIMSERLRVTQVADNWKIVLQNIQDDGPPGSFKPPVEEKNKPPNEEIVKNIGVISDEDKKPEDLVTDIIKDVKEENSDHEMKVEDVSTPGIIKIDPEPSKIAEEKVESITEIVNKDLLTNIDSSEEDKKEEDGITKTISIDKINE